ncbi:MAG TPA: hypothetical protein DEF47_20620 [Herpetosiphon sp.]|nr:hypothetical protein [Herpetosiphon sp.]
MSLAFLRHNRLLWGCCWGSGIGSFACPHPLAPSPAQQARGTIKPKAPRPPQWERGWGEGTTPPLPPSRRGGTIKLKAPRPPQWRGVGVRGYVLCSMFFLPQLKHSWEMYYGYNFALATHADWSAGSLWLAGNCYFIEPWGWLG